MKRWPLILLLAVPACCCGTLALNSTILVRAANDTGERVETLCTATVEPAEPDQCAHGVDVGDGRWFAFFGGDASGLAVRADSAAGSRCAVLDTYVPSGGLMRIELGDARLRWVDDDGTVFLTVPWRECSP